MSTPNGFYALPFFPRGDGPLVSVLLPTRGRPDYLRRAVDSLVSLAYDRGNLEFLFKADEDDPETISTIYDMQRICPPEIRTSVTISPRGRGYHDIWKWDNELAAQARGDWIFLMNDDAVIQTEHWDMQLMRTMVGKPWPGIRDCALLIATTAERPFAQEFVFLRRKVYELLGHLFLSAHGDNWLYSIAHFLGLDIFVPVLVKHFSSEIGDETRRSSTEAHKTTIWSLISTPAKWERFRDVAVLLTHMSQYESRMTWAPNHSGTMKWHYWRKEPGAVWYSAYISPEGQGVVFWEDGAKMHSTEELGGQWCEMV